MVTSHELVVSLQLTTLLAYRKHYFCVWRNNYGIGNIYDVMVHCYTNKVKHMVNIHFNRAVETSMMRFSKGTKIKQAHNKPNEDLQQACSLNLD